MQKLDIKIILNEEYSASITLNTQTYSTVEEALVMVKGMFSHFKNSVRVKIFDYADLECPCRAYIYKPAEQETWI
jgi:hypothetical protein